MQVSRGATVVLHLVILPETTGTNSPSRGVEENGVTEEDVTYDPASIAAARHWLYTQQQAATASSPSSLTSPGKDLPAKDPQTTTVENTFLQGVSSLSAQGQDTLKLDIDGVQNLPPVVVPFVVRALLTCAEEVNNCHCC